MTDDPEQQPFYASHCNVAWGEQGLLLHFSEQGTTGKKQREIALSPLTATTALDALRTALALHEKTHGVSWSEHDAWLGTESDRRTGMGEGGDSLGPHGRSMYRLLKNLPLNGYERSFKLLPGSLLTERFLLGIRLDRLRPDQLEEIVTQLGLPAVYRDTFRAALPRTRFLHFGHEASPERTVRKLYQEYEPISSGEETLLYTGYKWDPESPSQHVLSEYRLQPAMPLAAMFERVTALHPARPDIAGLCIALLQSASNRRRDAKLLYVEVSEEGNPRLSCDINLYAADVPVVEIEPLLEEAAGRFGIPSEALARRVPQLREARLGHVSSGTARNGAPFLTIYYALPESTES